MKSSGVEFRGWPQAQVAAQRTPEAQKEEEVEVVGKNKAAKRTGPAAARPN